MTGLTLYLLLGAAFMGAAGWMVYVLALRCGQLDDAEDVKYSLFDCEEEAEERT